MPAQRPGLGGWEAGRSGPPPRRQTPGAAGAPAPPRRFGAGDAAAENRVQCDCAKGRQARVAAEESAVRLRRAAWRGAGPGRVESGPSEALVSFADLGGAEEDEAALGLTRPGLWGAPAGLFIYLPCVPPSARAPLLGGEGVGGGPGASGSRNRVETPRDL